MCRQAAKPSVSTSSHCHCEARGDCSRRGVGTARHLTLHSAATQRNSSSAHRRTATEKLETIARDMEPQPPGTLPPDCVAAQRSSSSQHICTTAAMAWDARSYCRVTAARHLTLRVCPCAAELVVTHLSSATKKFEMFAQDLESWSPGIGLTLYVATRRSSASVHLRMAT